MEREIKVNSSKLDCGCIVYTEIRKDKFVTITSTRTIECLYHSNITKKNKELKAKEDKKKESFLKTRAGKISLLLNEMVDELGNNGVDVSYFPSSAYKVLVEYAKKIDKLKR